MAEFEVRSDQLKKSAENGRIIYMKLDDLGGKISSVSNTIALGSTAGRIVKDELRELVAKTTDNATKTQKIFESLENINTCYRETEKKIQSEKITTGSDSKTGTKTEIETKIDKKDSLWDRIWKNRETITGTVAKGEIATSGTILGWSTGGKLEGNILGGSIKRTSKAKGNTGKKDAEIGENIELEGHLAEGKISGNLGILNGSLDGKIGTIGGTGTIGATLYKDGKLSPAITAKIKGEVAVAKGSAEARAGSERNNIHGNASGTLYGAEGEISGSAGRITYKDKTTGTTKTEWGVSGKFKGEAYAAQGKISGGFTFLGIKVDIGVSGKAGGGGFSYEHRITTGGAKGEIGAGLGVGAGLEVGIDWSNFSLKW